MQLNNIIEPINWLIIHVFSSKSQQCGGTGVSGPPAQCPVDQVRGHGQGHVTPTRTVLMGTAV